MRNYLKPMYGHKRVFKGTFERFGINIDEQNYPHPMLIKDVIDEDGNYVANHVWLQNPPDELSTEIKPGDCIEFVALVTAYQKTQYGLKFMKEMKKIG